MEMIEKQAAIDALEWLHEYDFVLYHDMKEDFEKIPTIDAEPVRRGRWIIHTVMWNQSTPTGRHFGECSECGRLTGEWTNIMPQLNFCAYCGARMEVDDGE